MTDYTPQQVEQSPARTTKQPIQRILFGSPGTGKSHQIDHEIIREELGIDDPNNVIKTVFHPEYTYGDFMGKLVPITNPAGKVEYNHYPGHFLKALARAYGNILKSEKQKNQDEDEVDSEQEPLNVALVIDEINRGNSAAIFGTVFQLLDREKNGWSSYYVNITELELTSILRELGVEFKALQKDEYEYRFPGEQDWKKNLITFQNRVDTLKLDLKQKRIYLPPNLHILATMNTSDNSIYFMDNAFKRRWDWEFVNIEMEELPEVLAHRQITLFGEDKGDWTRFVDKLNEFIRSNFQYVRKIEDKQIGYFFINSDKITEKEIRSKLMFFIWDSAFQNNKRPLVELLWGKENVRQRERDLVTFGQFSSDDNVGLFVDKILAFIPLPNA